MYVCMYVCMYVWNTHPSLALLPYQYYVGPLSICCRARNLHWHATKLILYYLIIFTTPAVALWPAQTGKLHNHQSYPNGWSSPRCAPHWVLGVDVTATRRHGPCAVCFRGSYRCPVVSESVGCVWRWTRHARDWRKDDGSAHWEFVGGCTCTVIALEQTTLVQVVAFAGESCWGYCEFGQPVFVQVNCACHSVGLLFLTCYLYLFTVPRLFVLLVGDGQRIGCIYWAMLSNEPRIVLSCLIAASGIAS
jgi:hypothetical protein